jgi:Ca2+:H+ antiporter
MMSTLLVLAAAAIAIPTIATAPGGPAHGHETELSVVVSIVLLVVFAASVPFSIGKGSAAARMPPPRRAGLAAWPLWRRRTLLLSPASARPSSPTGSSMPSSRR